MVSITSETLWTRGQRPGWAQPVWTLWRRLLTHVGNRTVQSVIPWLLTMASTRVTCATSVTTHLNYNKRLLLMHAFVNLGYHLLRSDDVGKWKRFLPGFSWHTQLNMFREIILPIFRNTRLCVTACGVMHPPRCCRPSAGNMLMTLCTVLVVLLFCCW